MKRVLISISLFAALSSLAQAETIRVARSIPYAEDAEIAGKIKRECTFQTQLTDFIKEFGGKQGLDIELVDAVDETGSSPQDQ